MASPKVSADEGKVIIAKSYQVGIEHLVLIMIFNHHHHSNRSEAGRHAAWTFVQLGIISLEYKSSARGKELGIQNITEGWRGDINVSKVRVIPFLYDLCNQLCSSTHLQYPSHRKLEVTE